MLTFLRAAAAVRRRAIMRAVACLAMLTGTCFPSLSLSLADLIHLQGYSFEVTSDGGSGTAEMGQTPLRDNELPIKEGGIDER